MEVYTYNQCYSEFSDWIDMDWLNLQEKFGSLQVNRRELLRSTNKKSSSEHICLKWNMFWCHDCVQSYIWMMMDGMALGWNPVLKWVWLVEASFSWSSLAIHWWPPTERPMGSISVTKCASERLRLKSSIWQSVEFTIWKWILSSNSQTHFGFASKLVRNSI